jgi:arginyl-tRNA synthetase
MVCQKSFNSLTHFLLGETPESTGLKPDHLVGKWYVEFENQFKKEYETWLASDEAKVEFEKWKNSKGGKTILSKNAKYVFLPFFLCTQLIL